jgi:hypothetical protein
VHPLRDGWTWAHRANGGWCARFVGNGYRCDVWISASTVCAARYIPMGEPWAVNPPDDVALAVILASKGLDSLAAMADALETEARNHRASRERFGYNPHPNDATSVEDAYTHAAAMLGRGMVNP